MKLFVVFISSNITVGISSIRKLLKKLVYFLLIVHSILFTGLSLVRPHKSVLINQFVPPTFCLYFAFTGINFQGLLHHICDVVYDENMYEPMKACKCRSTNLLINYMPIWPSDVDLFLINLSLITQRIAHVNSHSFIHSFIHKTPNAQRNTFLEEKSWPKISSVKRPSVKLFVTDKTFRHFLPSN